MRLERVQSEFWDYQTTVTEDGIIAKIMRVIEKGPSTGFTLLTPEQHESLNTYECIGFFKPAYYQRIAIAIPVGPPVDSWRGEDMRVISSKPEADIAYHKVGQAQLWYSTTSKICVLWECLAFGEVKPRAKEFWRWLLEYIEFLRLKETYTHDSDVDYPQDEYDELLRSLGFELVRDRVMMRRSTF